MRYVPYKIRPKTHFKSLPLKEVLKIHRDKAYFRHDKPKIKYYRQIVGQPKFIGFKRLFKKPIVKFIK